MRNITPDIDTNIGGLDIVFFTPVENITGYPVQDGLVLRGDVTLKENCVWYLMGYTRDTASYEQQQKTDRRGTIYELKQKGFIPRDAPELGSALYDLARRRFALMFRDRNGFLRITAPGTYATFTHSFASGDSPADRNGYKVSFEGEGVLPALYYAGAFEVSELGIVKPPAPGEGNTVTIMFNGQVVRLVQPGQILEVTSPYTLGFDIRFI
ncbi:hypothetical protein [Pontibacter sp. SGAir0037]|uniref:hypothetical protein n=1 Tax=Pontibacter sp. SGAir0037 TaxID=2571030 RepID=UPI0010CD10F7|nr:hypothetical protein [Pontibacter sp. SGAir0037]QCR23090.1 hypothetical protein C1N53_12530 [Pontibacter sp. SGAir0037]